MVAGKLGVSKSCELRAASCRDIQYTVTANPLSLASRRVTPRVTRGYVGCNMGHLRPQTGSILLGLPGSFADAKVG